MWRTKDRRMCTGLYRLCVCVCALWKQLRSQRNGSFVPRLRAKGVLCTLYWYYRTSETTERESLSL